MSSRAERRRKHKTQNRNQTKTESRLASGRPLIDFVVYDGEAATLAGGLPEGPSTITHISRLKETAGPGVVYATERSDSRNKAAARGDAPFIVFLDADVQGVTAEAVALAVATLEAGAAVVSGLLVRGGRVFAAGYAINHQGRPYQRFAGWSPDAAKVQERREDLQAVPIHFMATRRDVWRQIRFRPEFADWALAEADYCTRAKKAGLGAIVYEPRIRLETEGQHLPPLTGAAVQLYVSSAGPAYDEYRVL